MVPSEGHPLMQRDVWLSSSLVLIWAATWENRIFAYAKTKTQISFAVTAKLISVFVFATRIVQSLDFLNPKLQVSSHLLWLYSQVCVGPGRKPRRPVFWLRGSYVSVLIGATLIEFRTSMLTPIEVGDKLFNLPIIALIAHIKWAATSENRSSGFPTRSPHKSGCAASENG